METEDIIVYAIVGYVAYNVLKKGLLEPEGITTQKGLSNAAERMGTTINELPDRTFITAGDTTYSVKNSELSETGFIKRRSAVVGALPSFLQFDFLKQWVYN